MAGRYLRGTFTRNAWDFYEVGTAFAFASNFTTGSIGLMLINNGVGNSYLDIYRADFNASLAGSLYWIVGPSAVVTNPQDPQTYYNSPCQLDLGGPPGLMVVFSTYTTGGTAIIKQRIDSVTYDTVELRNGGPFVSLPPNYGLAALFGFSGVSTTVSASIWYQSITDHKAPAM